MVRWFSSILCCYLNHCFLHLIKTGSYSTYIICVFTALCYLLYYVKEPISSTNKPKPTLKTILVNPVKDMGKAIIQKRDGYLRFLLLIQFLSYALLWFNYQIYYQEYYYLLKIFTNFTEDHYSYFLAVRSTIWSIFMLAIFPKLSVHPSLYCVLALSFQVLIFFVSPWPTNLWLYFGIQLLDFCYYATWANARTLFTFCVEQKDIGKIYAFVGVVAALTPLVSNPAYRKLYNAVSTNCI